MDCFTFVFMKSSLVLLLFFTLTVCQNSKIELESQPLYVVNGTIVQAIDSISPDEIDSIHVLKGEKAQQAYGKKGIHGVIEITLK